MKIFSTFCLVISIIAMSTGIALSAADDAGHVHFVDPVTPEDPEYAAPDSPGQTERPADNRNTVKPNTTALRGVVITPEASAKIASHFPGAQGKTVYSMIGSENVILDTDTRGVNEEFKSHLASTGEEILLAFPRMTAAAAGIYVTGVDMNGTAEPKTLIDSVSTITPSGSAASLRAAADIQQINLLDQAGNPVDTKRATNGLTYAVVPDNQNMLVAVELNAGETWTGSLTKPSQLPNIVVEAVTIEQIAEIAEQTDTQTQTETREETVERITNNIVEVVQEIISRPEVVENIINNNILSKDILSRDITSADIRTFTSQDIITDAEEPTKAMQEAVKQDGYEIAAKLNTIQVSESGFYIFKVTLSEKSFEDIKGTEAKDLKVYALSDSEIEIMPSIISGLLNTFELLTMSGEKINTIGVREFLLIGLLESSKPMSLYLAKILLALLLGGCNPGFGVAAIFAVSVFVILYAKNHSSRK